ncbi:MAG: two-component regulator propeller domain-containing protein [Ignavibacteriaceae bacterium]
MTKSKRYIFALLINTFFYLQVSVQAQQVLTKFEHLSIEDGLSQTAVFCIMQDKNGFIWIGTEDGLNRYDGYDFVIKKNDPSDSSSLSNNTIFSIYQDSRGFIWIGTEGGGLNLYDPVHDSFKRFKYEQDNPNSLSDNVVKAVCEDKNGFIWIGTKNGLDRYDPVSGKFRKYKNGINDPGSLSNNYVHSLFYDSRQILWVGTEKGLNKYDPQKDNFKRFIKSPNDEYSLSHDIILSIAEDGNRNLWIGTFDGLNKFIVDSEKFFRYNPDNNLRIKDIRSLCIDNDNLWVGSRPDGLLKLNIRTGKFNRYIHVKDEPTGINRNSVYSVFKDSAGSLWIGTWGGGINILHQNAHNFKHYKSVSEKENELSSNDVRSVYKENDSIIWVGTRNDGLNRYNRNSGKTERFYFKENDPHSLSHNSVFSIFKDNNLLWIGTRDGLNKYNEKTKNFTRYYSPYKGKDNEEGIVNILKAKSGLFWLGTRGRGIILFNPEENKYVKLFSKDNSGLSDDFIFDIYEDSKGIFWIGTNNGLNRYDPASNTFSVFINDGGSNSIGNNVIWSIYEDKNSNLWFGTRGGLSFYNRERDNFTNFTEKDGLPNQVIYSMLDDNTGCLWLSTNNGISKFNIDLFIKEKKVLFNNFTTSDGIQSQEFNFGAYHKSNDGELFFGGINGFNSFLPSEIKLNEYIPPVVITDLKVMNKSITVQKSPGGAGLDSAILFKRQINLSYRDNIISFKFAALNFFAPGKNKYMYKLDGFNDEWKHMDNGQRSVTYTNLDPGEYVFQVKASNNDGIWNPAPAQVIINISPPFWNTIYFRIAAALLLGTFILSLFYMRLKKVKEEKVKQENFSRQLIEKQETERKRIAAELHDSLGQNLLLIKNRAVLGLQYINGNKDLAEHVSEISSIASETLKEVRQISHNLRPYQLDRLGLTDAVKGAVKKVAESSAINFELQCDDIDDLVAKEKEINIYRILQEALNNIIKHSDAANAQLSFLKKDDNLIISISDDGKGFNGIIDREGDGLSGYGLTGIQERVKILNGKLFLNSAQGNGVKLAITLPVDK